MTDQNDGGPAYPVFADGQAALDERTEFHYGMSLRDWFAGQALVGALGNVEFVTAAIATFGDKGATDSLARSAYEFADAMLKARGE